jgi:hypothetical protein
MPSTALEEQGWTYRFTAIGLRLSEAVDLYLQLGYEVHLEPAGQTEDQFESEVCRHCFVTTQARTIYTKVRTRH